MLLLHWEYTTTCFPSTQKCSTPTLGVDTKICLLGQMLYVLVNTSLEKFQLYKRGMGYAKVIHKKRKKVEKMDKCPRYLKTMGT